MKVIIDRFEGDFAVCEKHDKTMINIKRNKIPSDAQEGSILMVNGDYIILDVNETELRKDQIKKMMDGLWE